MMERCKATILKEADKLLSNHHHKSSNQVLSSCKNVRELYCSEISDESHYECLVKNSNHPKINKTVTFHTLIFIRTSKLIFCYFLNYFEESSFEELS